MQCCFSCDIAYTECGIWMRQYEGGIFAYLHEHQSFMIWPGTDHCSFKSQDRRGWAKRSIRHCKEVKDHQERFRKELDHWSPIEFGCQELSYPVACMYMSSAVVVRPAPSPSPPASPPPPSLGDDMGDEGEGAGGRSWTKHQTYSLLYDFLYSMITRCQFLPNRSLTLLQVLVDFSDGVLRGTFSPWAEWRASVPNFVQISLWHVKHVNTLHIFSGNQGQSSRYTWLTNQRHWRHPKRHKIQKPHETTWIPKLFTISRPRDAATEVHWSLRLQCPSQLERIGAFQWCVLDRLMHSTWESCRETGCFIFFRLGFCSSGPVRTCWWTIIIRYDGMSNAWRRRGRTATPKAWSEPGCFCTPYTAVLQY